jgi:hypothetical protein
MWRRIRAAVDWARIERAFVAWGLEVLPLVLVCPLTPQPEPGAAGQFVDVPQNRGREPDAYR